MKRLLPILVLLCGMAAAQQKDPVLSALRSTLDRAAKNLTGAADAMPADKYNYKPTADQLTFAHVIHHTAEGNESNCAKISGQPAPQHEKIGEDAGKEKLAAWLKESFAYCQKALAGTGDTGLADEVELFGGRKGTKAQLILIMAGGWGNHYARAADYLRLNNVLPPTAQPRQ